MTYLWHIGTNLQYKHSGSHHGMSKGCVSESIAIVNDVLYKHLVPKYIKPPTEEEARHEAWLFSQLSGFPELIWSSIDGTHIEGNSKTIS